MHPTLWSLGSAAVAVKARLEGHSFDLDCLARLFREGDPRVGSDEEGYYLASSAFDDLFQDGGRLYEAVSAVLRRANGVARALEDGFRPVRLSGRFSEDNGAHHHVVLAETAEARDQALPVLVAKDGVTQQPPSPAPGYLNAATHHPDVVEVLDLLGKDVVALRWFDLYKIYEIVRDNVGGEQGLIAKNWVPEAEIKAFRASANLPALSGVEARHARRPPGTPKHTMTLHQARNMISGLVVAWLKSL